MFEVDERVGFPEAFAQFFARDDVPGTPDQRNQDLTRLFLEADTAAIAVQLTGGQIELELAEPHG